MKITVHFICRAAMMHNFAAVIKSSRAFGGVDMDFSMSGCISHTIRAEPPPEMALEFRVLVPVVLAIARLLCHVGNRKAFRG